MKTVEEVLGKVLNIDLTKITDETGPANTDAWDSFSGLLLVTELEKNFNIKLSIDDVVEIKNVGDIKKVLRKYGIKT